MSYHVVFQVPERPVGYRDIPFQIKRDDALLGRLKVSKGGIVWLPGNKSKGFRLTWDQVDRLARDQGRRGHYPR
ncbi:MAG TPA: hypothetical protein VGM03_04195 [Phycisphaerae bacterium]|jgi:hypothetical protein